MMLRRALRSAAVLSLGVGVASCGDETPLVPVVSEAVLLLTQPEGQPVFFSAEYRGEVVLDEAGCFRLDLVPPDNATVLWPAGTTLWARGDQLELRDPRGRRIVSLGASYRFVGGFVAALDDVTDLDASEREATRTRCPGNYWLFQPGSARAITRNP